MTSLLERGMAMLADRLDRDAPRTVIYRRGASAVELPATIGSTTFEAQGDSGVVQRIESRDFVVTADRLVLDGSKATPQRGDVIEETVSDATHKYEVLYLSGEPCWRYCDPLRTLIRIHTKKIGET